MAVKNKCSEVAETGDRLAAIDMGRKEGSYGAPFGGRWGVGSPSDTIWPGPIYLSTKYCATKSIQPFATTDMGRKLGRCCDPLGRSWVPI